MRIKQWTLSAAFMLSGLLLDAQWTWYSYHFEAACAESGNSVPATWLLFTALMLIPAGASLIFHSHRGYFPICLATWLFYVALQFYLISDGYQFEGFAGVNCYRDVGAGTTVSLVFAALFAATIIAISLAFGAVHLVQAGLRRGS